jgi:2-methylcitrate dehydratase PrpD
VVSLGEALGVSGRQLLEAYAVGYEVTAKLVHALRDSTHDGWHGPSALGSLGAAAACSKLLGLNGHQVQMALGITASMSSGLVANFGTMTKPLHVGLGARNGVLGAKLAASGFTANAQAIEAGSVGLFDTLYSGTPINYAAIDELGGKLALLSDGLRIKPYPCGGLTHQVIDSILELRAKNNLTPEMVEGIDVDVVKHTFDRIAFRVPQNGIQGKFCMPYLVARAMLDGKVGIDIFTDETVKDAKILSFAERVQMRRDDSLTKSGLAGRPSRVTIRLKDGRNVSREAQHAKGSPEFPMSEEELRGKFTECAHHAISDGAARGAMDMIANLESVPNIRALTEIVRG